MHMNLIFEFKCKGVGDRVTSEGRVLPFLSVLHNKISPNENNQKLHY